MLLVSNVTSLAIKSKLCPLEERALEILADASSSGRFLPYSEAVDALANFRINRKLALKLLTVFKDKEIVTASCGHGVKILEECGV